MGHFEALDRRQPNANGDLRLGFGTADPIRRERVCGFGRGVDRRISAGLGVFDLSRGVDRHACRALSFRVQDDNYLFSSQSLWRGFEREDLGDVQRLAGSQLLAEVAVMSQRQVATHQLQGQRMPLHLSARFTPFFFATDDAECFVVDRTGALRDRVE